jgi:two-component system, NtrC family, sensor kinase
LRRGTAVTLFLPRSFEAPALPREPALAADAPLPAGSVLLVEDDADVIEIARAYLRELGYSVKQAASAQAGLDILNREGEVDLLFSDILMRGCMNGLDLAREVRRRFPAILVLLTSGYSSSAQAAVGQGFEVLQKPYDLAALKRGLDAARKAVEQQAAFRAALLPERAAS